MSIATQLDFFENLDEYNFLRKMVLEDRETVHKTRKKLFAMQSELKSKVDTELLIFRAELEQLKSQLNRKAEILSFCIEK